MEVHNGINNQPVIVDGVRTPFRRSNKAFKDINCSIELGKEVGEILKKESKNSYKR